MFCASKHNFCLFNIEFKKKVFTHQLSFLSFNEKFMNGVDVKHFNGKAKISYPNVYSYDIIKSHKSSWLVLRLIFSIQAVYISRWTEAFILFTVIHNLDLIYDNTVHVHLPIDCMGPLMYASGLMSTHCHL